MQLNQLIVIASTVAILCLTIPLAVLLTKEYFRKGQKSYLYWSQGMWAFALSVLLEVVFAAGLYNQLLIEIYLFMVAALVELLALGSIQLIKSERLKNMYGIFILITTAALIFVIARSSIGNLLLDTNGVNSYVVIGQPTVPIIVVSSIITFAASAILIAVALIGYLKTRKVRMLSIVAGVAVVVLAGTLYIVSLPVLLYYSEFIGIVLLWIGFWSPRHR